MAIQRELHVLVVVLELLPAAFQLGVRGGRRPRPGGWRQKSPSSAVCTRVPLTAWGEGGSGRRSICENRKASGQLVKATTFDGLSVRGRSSAITARIRRGGDAPAHPRSTVEKG